MDSEEDDVSENDILDWYKSEVADIWDTATDSAFSDLSANLTEMFRQVMNNVKQRNSPGQQVSAAAQVNGQPSISNGVHDEPMEATSTVESQAAPNTVVSVTTEQLMALLQDDEAWLENDPQEENEENSGLSVQLCNENHTTQTSHSKNQSWCSFMTEGFMTEGFMT